jgi:hypothetical protein
MLCCYFCTLPSHASFARRSFLEHVNLIIHSRTAAMTKPTKPAKRKAATKKQPKKKKQKVKGKKNDSRNAVPIYGASEYRIWRIFDAAEERWVRATGGQKKLVDSRVHRYGREVGYSNGEDDSLFDIHLKAVEERLRNLTYLKKSGEWRITNQGNFECYVLKAHLDDPYSQFLLEDAELT